MPVTLRYTYRLRPGRKAVRELEREWNLCRWLWNQAVEAKRERRYWLKDTDLTRLRAKHPWLAAGSVVAQQQVLRDFRRSNARRFKSARRDRPSLNFTKRDFPYKTAGCAYLAKRSFPWCGLVNSPANHPACASIVTRWVIGTRASWCSVMRRRWRRRARLWASTGA